MVETLKKTTHHLQQIFSVSGARGVQNLDFFLGGVGFLTMFTPGCHSACGSHDPPFTRTTWWLGFVYLVPRYHFNRRLITRSTSSNRKKWSVLPFFSGAKQSFSTKKYLIKVAFHHQISFFVLATIRLTATFSVFGWNVWINLSTSRAT